MKSNRLFILGIDGATFDLLDPWIEQGHLPNFARIINKGCRGNLTSTVPPTSPVAWTSMVTGKNPGKHGIIDWFRIPAGTYDNVLLCGLDRKEPALWEILSHEGKQVGIFNVPITYPPEEVRGFMISGIHTPRTDQPYTYPKNLAPELEKVCGPYIADVINPQRAFTAESLDQLEAMMESHRKVLFYLLSRYSWDFFMAVFVFADRLQHALWSSLDSRGAEGPFSNVILDYYKRMDGILGELLQTLGDNTNLLIVSDHGFGPCYKGVSLNKLLCRMGLLKIKPVAVHPHHNVFTSLKKIPGLKTIISRSRFLEAAKNKIMQKTMPQEESKAEMVNIIDWAETKAYTPLSANGCIYINLQQLRPQGMVSPGREYEEVRDAIIKELRGVRDPHQDLPVFTDIYKKEEIYSGECLKEAPDLICFTRNMEYHFVDSFTNIETPEDDNIVMNLSSGLEAEHRMEGILMAYGPDFKAGEKLEPAHIYDIAPTSLYLLGNNVPLDVDGKILTQIIDPAFIKNHPPKYTEQKFAKDLTAKREKVYTPEEIAKIKEGLKGMGYLS